MRYLFERLSEATAATTEDFDVVAAVEAQLCRILVGYPGIIGEDDPNLLDFGLPAVVDMNLSASEQMEWLTRRVKQLIDHYEPRLTDVQVEVVPTTELLSPFRITVEARLKGDGEERVMRFPLEPSLH
jgi:type VI secretion system lysozyme-like protein